MLRVGSCSCSWIKSLPPTAPSTSYHSKPTANFSFSSQRPAFRLHICGSNVGGCEEEGRAPLQAHNRRSQMPSLADRLRPGGFTADDALSYKESFTIRCYEVGLNRTATIQAIANLLQEVACNHVQCMGFSTDGFGTTPTMRKRRLIWVTARMHIEVYQYPLWGDVVEIETWFQAAGKVGTRRDWIIEDALTKAVIGRATSTWVMMHQDTRRLSRVTDDASDEYMIFCPKLPRLAFPEEDSTCSKKIPKLHDPAEHSRYGLMARRSDLDMNQHVNNVTYIGWVLESMPQEVLDTHELQTITLDYRRECNKDDVVDSLTSLQFSISENIAVVDDSLASKTKALLTNGSATARSTVEPSSSPESFEFLHMLRLADSGFEINRGRTIWRRKLGR